MRKNVRMWDAYATKSEEFEYEENLRVVLSSPEVFALLENRSSLHGNQFRLLLEKATGESCYSDWTAEKVRQLAAKVDWNAPKQYLKDIPNVWTFWDESEFWDSYGCCKLFLEICASHNLGIHFCW